MSSIDDRKRGGFVCTCVELITIRDINLSFRYILSLDSSFYWDYFITVASIFWKLLPENHRKCPISHCMPVCQMACKLQNELIAYLGLHWRICWHNVFMSSSTTSALERGMSFVPTTNTTVWKKIKMINCWYDANNVVFWTCITGRFDRIRISMSDFDLLSPSDQLCHITFHQTILYV